MEPHANNNSEALRRLLTDGLVIGVINSSLFDVSSSTGPGDYPASNDT